MFKVGDKVVRKAEFLRTAGWSYGGEPVVVTFVRPNDDFQVCGGGGYWVPTRFNLYVEPVAEGVKRLRVVEGLGVLRQGTVVTVRDESATSYLLVEHPGKRYRKTRFEEIVAAPTSSNKERAITPEKPQVFKRGDAVYIVAEPKAGALRGYYDRDHYDGPMRKPSERVKAAISTRQKLYISGSTFPYANYYNGAKEQYYMVSEEEGSEGFYCAVSPEMIKPYPVAKALKVGDRFIVKNEIPTDIDVGYVEEFKHAYAGRDVLVVTHLETYDGRVCPRADFVVWPLEHLSFEDGSPIIGGAPFGLEKDKEPVPALVKAMEYEGSISGTSGWTVLFKDRSRYTNYLNQVCYGSMSGCFTSAVEKLGITMHHARRGHHKITKDKEEAAIRWWDYIINRSPWADCFIKSAEIPDAATGFKLGFEMNPAKNTSEIITAAICIRDAWEHQHRLKVFTHFVDEGYHEHTAYILAFALHDADGKFSFSSMQDTHTNMSGRLDAKGYFKFFREGYHKKSVLDKKPLNAGQSSGYEVSPGIAEWGQAGHTLYEFITKNVKQTTVGSGFEAKGYVSLEAANELAAIIEKEITK